MNKKQKQYIAMEAMEKKAREAVLDLTEKRKALPPEIKKVTRVSGGSLSTLNCPNCKAVVGLQNYQYPDSGAGEFSGFVSLEIVANCPFCGQAIIFRS